MVKVQGLIVVVRLYCHTSLFT